MASPSTEGQNRSSRRQRYRRVPTSWVAIRAVRVRRRPLNRRSDVDDGRAIGSDDAQGKRARATYQHRVQRELQLARELRRCDLRRDWWAQTDLGTKGTDDVFTVPDFEIANLVGPLRACAVDANGNCVAPRSHRDLARRVERIRTSDERA